MKRYLEEDIKEDLKEKMVLLGGPRQVGKTTFAKALLSSLPQDQGLYLNWDVVSHRKTLLKGELTKESRLVVLDELHKYKAWRGLVKGFFDTYKEEKEFLITGSARLDYFRRGGDSLQGRYHYYNLHPLSLLEISTQPKVTDLEHLLTYGGFPEPFLKSNMRHWRRWQQERTKRVLQEDLVSLERVNEITQLDLLTSLLPNKVGSLLSVSNMASDLDVSFSTTDKWIQILERLYYCFRIQAFGFSQIRSAKKEKKLYMWDWSLVENQSARFENIVASNLIKYCDYHKDRNGEKIELRFLRDSNKREIDFVVIKNNKPLFAVECKTGDGQVSSQVQYFSPRLNIPRYYQVHMGQKHFENKELKLEVIPFVKFVKVLGV
jgi:predicted AAA+ superfamily ATPase